MASNAPNHEVVLKHIAQDHGYDPERCVFQMDHYANSYKVIQKPLNPTPELKALFRRYKKTLEDEFRSLVLEKSNPDLHHAMHEFVDAYLKDFNARSFNVSRREYEDYLHRFTAPRPNTWEKEFSYLYQLTDKFKL